MFDTISTDVFFYLLTFCGEVELWNVGKTCKLLHEKAAKIYKLNITRYLFKRKYTHTSLKKMEFTVDCKERLHGLYTSWNNSKRHINLDFEAIYRRGVLSCIIICKPTHILAIPVRIESDHTLGVRDSWRLIMTTLPQMEHTVVVEFLKVKNSHNFTIKSSSNHLMWKYGLLNRTGNNLKTASNDDWNSGRFLLRRKMKEFISMHVDVVAGFVPKQELFELFVRKTMIDEYTTFQLQDRLKQYDVECK